VPTRDDDRARLHTRLGVLAAVVAGVDLGYFREAARGRYGYAALVGRPGWASALAGAGLLVALVAHAGLGVVRARADSDDAPYVDRDRRVLQWATALVLVPFAALRLGYGPLGGLVRGLDAFGLHQAMRDDFATLPYVVVQCLGASALALHFFQGVAAAARRAGRIRRIPAAFALSALYLVLYLDALAAFAIGHSLLPRF
jgi:hypothetical protein